jgi:hypothetical protein
MLAAADVILVGLASVFPSLEAVRAHAASVEVLVALGARK